MTPAAPASSSATYRLHVPVGQEARGNFAHAPLAHDRLDQDSGGPLTGRRFDGGNVEGGDLVEAVGRRTETFEMLRLRACRDGGERPAVEGAFEGDEPVALGRAGLEVIAAGGLDRALDRFGTRIGKKRHVGEGRGAEPLGQTLLLWDAVQIGDVPQPFRLLGQSAHEMRMGMAERGHGDAARKVEIALA